MYTKLLHLASVSYGCRESAYVYTCVFLLVKNLFFPWRFAGSEPLSMTKTTILVRSNTTCLAGCTIVHVPSRRVGHGRHRCLVAGLKLPGGRRIEWPQLRRVDVAESDGRIGDPFRGRGQRPSRRWERPGGLPSPRPERSIVFRWGVRRGSTAITPLIGRERDVGGLSSCCAPDQVCAGREHVRLVCTVHRSIPERGALRIETVTIDCLGAHA